MSTYPPVGETWIFDIGPAQIEHHYTPDREMRYLILTGHFAGATETVAIDVKEVPGGFLVGWQEANKTTVVHWEDFGNGVFESFATLPDHEFVHFSGKMWRKEPAAERDTA